MKPQDQLHQRNRTTKMLQEATQRALNQEPTILVLSVQKQLVEVYYDLCVVARKSCIPIAHYVQYISLVLYKDIKEHFSWETLTVGLPDYANKLILVDHLVIAMHYYNTNYAEGAALEMLTRYDLVPA